MVHLQRFHEKYRKDGLRVFVICMQDDLDAARKTTKERGWTFPVFDGIGSALGARFAFG